jgi:hypothetical protein
VIIKGKSRAGPQQLATHLGNAEKNERVSLIETRGTVAQDLRGAFVEMDAYAVGTHCEKSLYHAAISPAPPHRLTDDQRTEAVDALEARLGLDGHARVVVMHEKLGRQHIHVVWSRIDLEKMRSVSDSHNYRKHEEVARDLERRFGHDRVQGAHHERDGVKRPDRTASRAELQQQDRTGITGKMVKDEVTAAFRASDGPAAFRAALEERGYLLARGDRRDYVIIDRKGGVHSLARRIDGMKAAALREFMAAMNPESVPDIEHAREIIVERERRALERKQLHDEVPTDVGYAPADDYVSQTPAAPRDHRRQLPIEHEGAGHPPKDAPAPTPTPNKAGHSDHAGRSDARRKRLDRLAAASTANDRVRDCAEDDPCRQNAAPGGGHTWSR